MAWFGRPDCPQGGDGSRRRPLLEIFLGVHGTPFWRGCLVKRVPMMQQMQPSIGDSSLGLGSVVTAGRLLASLGIGHVDLHGSPEMLEGQRQKQELCTPSTCTGYRLAPYKVVLKHVPVRHAMERAAIQLRQPGRVLFPWTRRARQIRLMFRMHRHEMWKGTARAATLLEATLLEKQQGLRTECKLQGLPF